MAACVRNSFLSEAERNIPLYVDTACGSCTHPRMDAGSPCLSVIVNKAAMSTHVRISAQPVFPSFGSVPRSEIPRSLFFPFLVYKFLVG